MEMKTETEKDIQLLKAVAKVGFITESLFSYLNVSKYILNKNIENDYIVHRGNHLIYGNLRNIYHLTDKGKRRMRSEFLINPYKSDFTQLEHDYCLARVYCSLNFREKNSWITETELRIKYNLDKTADAMYISDSGEKIGVEIVTDSYSKEDIEKKKEFIRNYCDNFIMFHSHKNREYDI